MDADEDNLRKMIKAFQSLKFIPRIPVKLEEVVLKENRDRWFKGKDMLAFTLINPQNPFENVDLLFKGPIAFKKAYRKKKFFKSQKVQIPVISTKDLISMKKKAGRLQDLEDVRILKRVMK
ncbi:MAG: hypothetical protein HYZ83_03020 [Candidatus Omnitrophica bacterium]|nr:hypothetical protein [Candidatus Omnitrophota bacterium]